MKKPLLVGLVLTVSIFACGCATLLSYYGLNQVEKKVTATTTTSSGGSTTTIAPGNNSAIYKQSSSADPDPKDFQLKITWQ